MKYKQQAAAMLFGLSLMGACVFPASSAEAGPPCKVLVVMSYEKDFGWDKEMEAGIESVLAKSCELTYFYMDTKKNPDGGLQKATEAFELYGQYKPDGVIACDDAAQYMFVVPFLKDKVKTPVMFCGVNQDLEKYGYPASNVSGILSSKNGLVPKERERNYGQHAKI